MISAEIYLNGHVGNPREAVAGRSYDDLTEGSPDMDDATRLPRADGAPTSAPTNRARFVGHTIQVDDPDAPGWAKAMHGTTAPPGLAKVSAHAPGGMVSMDEDGDHVNPDSWEAQNTPTVTVWVDAAEDICADGDEA